ncbi:Rho GTPase-activating protein 31 [Saguinus oedipus]|uniref:Rho GTPase-activating protein 31 n=1 Tax=Saguinus oedipus TaxID=9490 RepID=A0ABQ9U4V5_SAGOE|nr:Rho GTPase-activating protein 31 [Saguinus oedipus]
MLLSLLSKEAVSHCPEEGQGQLARIQNVIQELPPSHYRTLEYLIRHLAHIASFSSKTNMHARNLALVWAPNLLRSKEIEATGCNGDAAFLAVRVQQVVIEFILNHVDQIFNSGAPGSLENDADQRTPFQFIQYFGRTSYQNNLLQLVSNFDPYPVLYVMLRENRPIMKSLTLPALSLPMKLVSLEEAQARSLATNHPARKERRENSLPEIVPPMGTLFHTVLELPDNKDQEEEYLGKTIKCIFSVLSNTPGVHHTQRRKLSSKSKKWKSIFNLGRSGSDSKSKLSRNGSVFVRGQRLSGHKEPHHEKEASTPKVDTDGPTDRAAAWPMWKRLLSDQLKAWTHCVQCLWKTQLESLATFHSNLNQLCPCSNAVPP